MMFVFCSPITLALKSFWGGYTSGTIRLHPPPPGPAGLDPDSLPPAREKGRIRRATAGHEGSDAAGQ
jgi:hypothetical protein